MNERESCTYSGCELDELCLNSGFCQFHYEGYEFTDCLICLSKFPPECADTKSSAAKLPNCNHIVHRECIFLSGAVACPYCMKSINATAEEVLYALSCRPAAIEEVNNTIMVDNTRDGYTTTSHSISEIMLDTTNRINEQLANEEKMLQIKREEAQLDIQKIHLECNRAIRQLEELRVEADASNRIIECERKSIKEEWEALHKEKKEWDNLRSARVTEMHKIGDYLQEINQLEIKSCRDKIRIEKGFILEDINILFAHKLALDAREAEQRAYGILLDSRELNVKKRERAIETAIASSSLEISNSQ